jgi:hypothetical protein
VYGMPTVPDTKFVIVSGVIRVVLLGCGVHCAKELLQITEKKKSKINVE